MRPLSELVDTNDPAWPEVQEWIAGATNAVEVLPERHRGVVPISEMFGLNIGG